MAEVDPVLREAIAKYLAAIYRGVTSEAVKWITDLMYYKDDPEYLKIFEKLVEEAEKRLSRPKIERFAERLDETLERMLSGPECNFESFRTLVQETVKLKERKLGKYIRPPEEFLRRAERILSEVKG